MKKYGVYDISGGQGWLNRWYHYKNWGTYTPYPISSYSCPGPGGCASRHSIDNPEDPKEADPNYEDGQTELERFAEANLALYYVAKDDNVLFFPMQPDRNDAFGQVPKFQWMKAMELNVGQPKPNQGNFLTPWNQFTLSQGTDPSTGRTTSFIADEVVTLNDPDASANPYNWEVKDFNPSTPWQTGQWDGYMTNQPPYYRVHHTGHNNAGNYNYAIIETYYGTAPTPTIGNTFTLGQTTTSKYSIYSREYDNAMIYYRSTGWGANEKSLSNVIIELPKTADNPTGVYYRLRGMNSFDPQIIDFSNPLTSINLRNNEGIILVKASALTKPEINKTVDKVNAASGDVLTYILSYSNPTTLTFPQATIEDQVPIGTTYVPGSASNGGSFDGTKVTWQLGTLASGASGSVTFQVRIQ